ncbi:MAG: flagellar filament capping protein FliD, partial [Spirochaetota bacterium]
THREISVRSITVFDPRTRGDVAPVNPMSTAGDAIVQIEGIDVVRTSNTVDDLIEGVTLNLTGISDRPVTVSVEPDLESVTESMIQFLFYYNELIREINILTRNERAVVDELADFTDEEREEALEKLGLMQGNLALSSLKSRLQTLIMDPYPTEAGSELALLAQLGISSNESGPSGGFDASRLRGYMEMNPTKVDEALRSRFVAVRQLFGSDSDGDRTIDTGVGYAIDQNLRPYVQSGGLIAVRTGGIERSISDTRSRIEREESRLEKVEARYRTEFAQMEGAMRQMQEQTQALDNLQTQTGGN